jgi:hypothetical protein
MGGTDEGGRTTLTVATKKILPTAAAEDTKVKAAATEVEAVTARKGTEVVATEVVATVAATKQLCRFSRLGSFFAA